MNRFLCKETFLPAKRGPPWTRLDQAGPGLAGLDRARLKVLKIKILMQHLFLCFSSKMAKICRIVWKPFSYYYHLSLFQNFKKDIVMRRLQKANS